MRFGRNLGPASILALAITGWFPGTAQHLRSPVVLTRDEVWANGWSTSAGDTTVAVWRSADSERLYVSTSDGRALEWSAPQRVDEGVPGTKSGQQAVVLDDEVLILWTNSDHLAGTGPYSQIYFNKLELATGLVGDPQWLSLSGDDPTDSTVSSLSVASASHAGTDYVYVATSLEAPIDPKEVAGTLVLAVSGDGGESFGAPVHLGEPAAKPGSIEIEAHASAVHVSWVAGVDGNVYFTTSHQAGAPGSFLAPPVQLDAASPMVGGVDHCWMEAHGSTVVNAWQGCYTDACVFDSVYVRVSTDGGITFETAKKLTSLAGPLGVQPAIDPATGNILVRHNFDDGSLYWANRLWISTDGGATFAHVLDQVDSFRLTTTGGPNAHGVVARTWQSSEIDPQSKALHAAQFVSFSHDGGTTWEEPSAFSTEDLGSSLGVYNSLYDNFIFLWQTDQPGDSSLVSGGFRAPTLIPHGWSAGPTTIHFELELFDPELDPLAFVVFSTETGDLLLPDGRSLGLALTPLLPLSLQAGAAGLLSATIGADGSGATPEVDVDLPLGLTIHAVGLGVDPESATAGHITDVVALDT